jgi:hypothetical protein
VQHERLIANLHGVSSVVTALIARDDVEMFGQEIDDLAFAFIAPLSADNYDYF